MWEAEREKSGKKKWIIIIVVVVLCCLCTAGVCIGVGYLASTEGWFDDIFGSGDGKGGEGGDDDKLPYCPAPTTEPATLPPTTTIDLSGKTIFYSSITNVGSTEIGPLDKDDSTCFLSRQSTLEPSDYTPWWRVDMEKLYVVVSVSIVGTKQAKVEHNDLEIRIGNRVEAQPLAVVSPFNSNTLCDEKPGPNTVFPIVFTCPKMLYGRHLNVQKVKFCKDCGNLALAICTLTVTGYLLPYDLIE